MSIEGQGHFLTLAKGREHLKIQTGFCRSEPFFMKAFRYKEMKDVGHMTKMAAMPIYGKNPSKIFSGTGRPISTKLGMKHRGLKLIKDCSNDDPRVTLTYFTASSNLETEAFLWEKVKTVDFSVTIAACDLKVG